MSSPVKKDDAAAGGVGLHKENPDSSFIGKSDDLPALGFGASTNAAVDTGTSASAKTKTTTKIVPKTRSTTKIAAKDTDEATAKIVAMAEEPTPAAAASNPAAKSSAAAYPPMSSAAPKGPSASASGTALGGAARGIDDAR